MQSPKYDISQLVSALRTDADPCHGHPDTALPILTNGTYEKWSPVTWKVSSTRSWRRPDSISLNLSPKSHTPQHGSLPESRPQSPIGTSNVDGVHERLGILRPIPKETSRDARSRSSDRGRYTTASRPSYPESDPDLRHNSADEVWDANMLLAITNSVRIGLKKRALTESDIETFSAILNRLLADEYIPAQAVELDIVSQARLDKLLSAIIDNKGGVQKIHPLFAEIALNALLLRNKWQRRFRARYFELDDARLREMKEVRLHDMSLIAGDQVGQKWTIGKRNPIDEIEGDLSFEPGAWWVNLCSAFRDGIVGNATEDVTRGHYGFTALPMVTGKEEDGPNGTVKLIKQGGLRAMYPNLITHVGREIRVLRGHTLYSKYAPLAGIRYDGLYKIIQYGHRLCTTTETYRLELTLERVQGQRSMEKILDIPLPSELDDWELYNRVLAEDIRVRRGDAAMQEWKKKEEGEEVERENWRSWNDFKRKHSQVGWATPRTRSRVTSISKAG